MRNSFIARTAAAAVVGIATLAAAVPASAAPDLTTVHVVQLCTSSQNPQFCNGIERATFTTTEQFPNMFVEFIADRGHCSDIIVRITVDGPVRAERQLAPGASTNAIFVDLDAGKHFISVIAIGVPGGCNTGKLGSFEGDLILQRVN